MDIHKIEKKRIDKCYVKMGIPKLNKWLLEKCSPQSIKKMGLAEYQDKRIAVDISIYLYRFLMDNRFMENLYLFLATLRYNCIKPVIIFDGKAPVEKSATIQKRRTEKQEAHSQFVLYEQQLVKETDENIRQNIIQKMNVLKKRMVRITWSHIDAAIELIQAFGFEYYLAPCEADQLCVHLAVTGDVYAVLSDDMDLIISGVPRIMRGFNINTHEIFLYDTQSILSDVHMTLEDFRNTVVLSGTDYEMKTTHPNFTIKRCFELYDEYKSSLLIAPIVPISFAEPISFEQWLSEKELIDPVEFKHICSMFDNDSSSNELTEFLKKNRPTTRPKINLVAIQKIMSLHKFIFAAIC